MESTKEKKTDLLYFFYFFLRGPWRQAPTAWAIVDDDAMVDVPRLIAATRKALRKQRQTDTTSRNAPGVQSPPPPPFYGGFAKVSKFRSFEGEPVEWCDNPMVVFNPDGLTAVAAALRREGSDRATLAARHAHLDLMVGNVARRQGIKCTPLTGSICQPKFQSKTSWKDNKSTSGSGGGCSPVTDGDVLRHLVLHGLVGTDLTAAHERLKRLRRAAGADASFGAGTHERQSQSANGEDDAGDEEDEGVAGEAGEATAATVVAVGRTDEAARLHGVPGGGEGRGGLPLEPVEREAVAAAAREVRRSADSFAARRVSRARWTALWQTALGAGGSALAFFAALKLGRVRARPVREKLFFEYKG